jgi:3-hydroxyacyl-CoA dehydrogenase
MTDSPISTHKHHDILIVTSNNPPVNALGAAVRQGLVAAIEQAELHFGNAQPGRRQRHAIMAAKRDF